MKIHWPQKNAENAKDDGREAGLNYQISKGKFLTELTELRNFLGRGKEWISGLEWIPVLFALFVFFRGQSFSLS